MRAPTILPWSRATRPADPRALLAQPPQPIPDTQQADAPRCSAAGDAAALFTLPPASSCSAAAAPAGAPLPTCTWRHELLLVFMTAAGNITSPGLSIASGNTRRPRPAPSAYPAAAANNASLTGALQGQNLTWQRQQPALAAPAASDVCQLPAEILDHGGYPQCPAQAARRGASDACAAFARWMAAGSAPPTGLAAACARQQLRVAGACLVHALHASGLLYVLLVVLLLCDVWRLQRADSEVSRATAGCCACLPRWRAAGRSQGGPGVAGAQRARVPASPCAWEGGARRA
jgi:hypothetical protein